MMVEWIAENWIVIGVALFIGVVTAYWMWRKRPGLAPDAAEMPPLPADQPVPAQTPVPGGKPAIAAAIGEPDNLLQIKGIGPKLNALLAELGITRFDQIAGWSSADVAEVDPYLESFKGRIVRDNWVDQAGYLTAGDIAGFEAKYGKL